MDIEAIKGANRIEEVIQETTGLTLRGRGKYVKPQGQEGSSLVVNVDQQLYNWNAKGHAGDVISWLENTQNMEFHRAVEWLCKRASLPLQWDGREAERWKLARARQDALTTIAGYLQGKLAGSAAALAWVEGRGWSRETLERAGCGFWDGDRKALADHVRLHGLDAAQGMVQAVMQMPAAMFVYGHYLGGRCCYLSGRSIEGKRHWNLPAQLAGEKQPFWNHIYSGRATHVVVVEGQADALTLAQWNVPAVALAGLNVTPDLVKQLGEHERVYVALDRDPAGGQAGALLARELGPLTRVVEWPFVDGAEVKDANDWLRAGATEDDCRDLLGEAENYAVWLCRRAAAAGSMEKEDRAQQALDVVAGLPEYAYEKARHACAQLLGLGVTRLDRIVRQARKEATEAKGQRSSFKRVTTSPGGYVEGHLYEMLYDPDERKTDYVVRAPDGTIERRPSLELDEVVFEPLAPWESMVEKFQIRFTSGCEDYHNEEMLYHQMRDFVHKYLDVDETFEKICVFYALMTWRFDQFNIVPYLRFLGQTGSGKSRGLKVVGALCFRPMRLVAVTPASIFHAIDMYGQLTMLFEEMDLGQSDYTAEVLQIINAGYAKENMVPRVVKGPDGNFTLKAYQIFGPKVFAQRQPFGDAATNSRCLTKEMNSVRPREDIDHYVDDVIFWAHAEALRRQLLYYRMKNWQPDIQVQQLKGYQLPARMQEILVSLKSVIVSPELHAELDAFMGEMYEQSVVEWSLTLDARVVEALLVSYYQPDEKARKMAAEHGDELRLQLKLVTERLNAILDRDNDVQRQAGDTKGMVSSRKVGAIARRELNLTTKQQKHRRTWYVEWDEARMEALAIRYGLVQMLRELRENGGAELFEGPMQGEIPI